MSAIPKKKLCWHCDGNIAIETTNCVYCGVYLHPDNEQKKEFWQPSYNPVEHSDEVPIPPYKAESILRESVEKEVIPEKGLSLFDQIKLDLLPIVLLMAGTVFVIFALTLFLFSEDGKLTLQWNGDNWIYFFLLGIPALFFGTYFLNQSSDD